MLIYNSSLKYSLSSRRNSYYVRFKVNGDCNGRKKIIANLLDEIEMLICYKLKTGSARLIKRQGHCR